MLHICTIPISVNLSLIRYARARFFILNFKINFNETVKTEEMLILLNSKPGRMYIICKFLTIDFWKVQKLKIEIYFFCSETISKIFFFNKFYDR